jgi:hypothetical protein
MKNYIFLIFITAINVIIPQPFTEVSTGLPGIDTGSASWIDYDNDNDLDIFIAGWTGAERISKLYRNDRAVQNTPPAAPDRLDGIGGAADNNFLGGTEYFC